MTTLVLGSGSDIAIALVRLYASQGHRIQLAARNEEELNALKNDTAIRFGVEVEAYAFDALDFDNHENWYAQLKTKPDNVILVFGYLGDHQKSLSDWNKAKHIIDVNYTGAVSILNVVANDFASQKKGTIIGISSVAGDRGRMSNYIYGSAKAGFTAYLSGLRNRLYHSQVHVMTVKPGFVRTKMTEGLPLSKPLTAEPAIVAKTIFKAAQKKKNVIYVLPIWSILMLIIRSIPESIFKKLKL